MSLRLLTQCLKGQTVSIWIFLASSLQRQFYVIRQGGSECYDHRVFAPPLNVNWKQVAWVFSYTCLVSPAPMALWGTPQLFYFLLEDQSAITHMILPTAVGECLRLKHRWLSSLMDRGDWSLVAWILMYQLKTCCGNIYQTLVEAVFQDVCTYFCIIFVFAFAFFLFV